VARDRQAELVIVGRGERRGATELIVGSTAERIVRTSDVSVLIVSKAPEAPYRRPLVAIDLSELSRRAVELALRIADAEVAEVDCLHAIDLPYVKMLAQGGMSAAEIDAHVVAAERSAGTLLEGWIPRARAAGVRLNPILRRGDPRRIIAAEIGERRSDLVVVGTAGHSKLGRLLLGSVAESVMRSAPCDVLVVR